MNWTKKVLRHKCAVAKLPVTKGWLTSCPDCRAVIAVTHNWSLQFALDHYERMSDLDRADHYTD